MRAFEGFDAVALTEVTQWKALVEAAIDRLGGDDQLRARLFDVEGSLYLAQHRFADALAADRQSIALQPPNTVAVAATLNNVGVVLLKLDRRDEARQALQQAATALETTLGPTY